MFYFIKIVHCFYFILRTVCIIRACLVVGFYKSIKDTIVVTTRHMWFKQLTAQKISKSTTI